MLAGGMRHPEQHFNNWLARAQATMLTLAAIALVIPAAYAALVGAINPGGGEALSISISLVLLAVYAAFLLFSLWTDTLTFSRGVDAAENVAHSEALAAWAGDRGARRSHCRDRMVE